jgi:catechol 2,3-dioxygenase-like lactoylglutathione lyase family enzyme
MKIGHIELFVENPLKSKEFYVDILGFDLIEVQFDKFVWLQSGNIEILLRPGKNTMVVDEYIDSNAAIVIYTDNLDKTCVELQSRGLKFAGVDGNERCPTFKDPDGNWFQIVNPEEH